MNNFSSKNFDQAQYSVIVNDDSFDNDDLVTLEGIEILIKEVQFEKAPFPIMLTFSGISKLTKEEHHENE